MTFLRAQRQSNFAQVRIVYLCVLCMCIQSSTVEILTPTQCNLIGRSMTAPLPVLSPSSILSPPSSPRAFIHPGNEKFGARFKNFTAFIVYFLKNLRVRNCVNLKLRIRAMSVFAKCLVRISSTAQTVLTYFSWFFSVPSPNVGTVRQIWPRLLPSTYLQMRHSLLVHHSMFLSQHRLMNHKEENKIDQEH
jgi:hypothetical protein